MPATGAGTMFFESGERVGYKGGEKPEWPVIPGQGWDPLW